ncbi:MAG: DUF1295 domain-containing protein [Saccharofermentans sp.]|nr:DUF1295 domain-containing protein [Saccharofermentans sp.]
MDRVFKDKGKSVALITVIYLIASVIGYMTYKICPFDYRISLLIADIIATCFVFAFSCLFDNSSVYDPYWSVQPIVIAGLFYIKSGLSISSLLALISILYWGIRLTLNWAYTFKDMKHQDWRYDNLKKQCGVFYPIVNLLGIHMMPTVVVYLCVLPAVTLMKEGSELTVFSAGGMLVCLLAASLQLVADLQMQRYRAKGTHGLIREGLWKYSRHPNYLGEILMWWGIALQGLPLMSGRWYLLSGAILNTLMFITISIPLADKRQSKKPGYGGYKKATRALLPIPR